MSLLIAISLMLSLSVQPATLQASESAAPIEIMIVGTFHMDSPSRDLINPTVKNVLGEQRQKEILEVVSKLQEFKPTKIALELPPSSAMMQERLTGYLNGTYVLTADERDQIGLRLAKNLGHKKVYGIDFRKGLPMQETFEWANKNGQGEVVQQIMGEVQAKVMPRLSSDAMEKRTIRENLYDFNNRESDELNHNLYMMMSKIGKEDQYIGADMVAAWYERNLKIAVNAARIAEPGDRILVLFGAGHAKLLKQFLRETPGFKLVDANDYLKP